MQSDIDIAPDTRAVRTSAGWANSGKIEHAKKINVHVFELKKKISEYIRAHMQDLIDDPKEFYSRYKLFTSKEPKLKDRIIGAWEIQTLFADICKIYENSIDVRKAKISTSIQSGYQKTYYTKTHKKGQLKSWGITKTNTELGKIVKILSMLDVDNLEQYRGEEIYQHIEETWMHTKFWERIVSCARQIRMHMLLKIKVAKFTTGTYRINLSGDEFITDESNTKFKHWFRYRNEYYPLQINADYHKNIGNLKTQKNKQVFVKITDDKVHFIFVEDRKLSFNKLGKVLGLDINIKNNFCTTSDKRSFDYDRTYINEFLEEIKKIDAIGYQNINEKQKIKLEKIVAKNGHYFKKKISEILHQLHAEDVTEIIMEDITNFAKGKFDIKNEEFNMSYTRLTRLLRLGNIKKWFKEQAEKLGIRVHITTPAYSSQQCPMCHSIDRKNRKTQEDFECIECGFKENADYVAATNLSLRFSSDVLRKKLHTCDQHGRLLPRKLTRETIKKILSSQSSGGKT